MKYTYTYMVFEISSTPWMIDSITDYNRLSFGRAINYDVIINFTTPEVYFENEHLFNAAWDHFWGKIKPRANFYLVLIPHKNLKIYSNPKIIVTNNTIL